MKKLSATPDAAHIILFDSVCKLCSAWVIFVIQRDPNSRFRFASVQSETGQHILPRCNLPTDRFDTMVYIENNHVYTQSTAFLKIVRHFPSPWPLLAVARFVPRPLRDWLYDRIALNRYRLFGKTDVCFTPSDDLLKRFCNVEQYF